MRRLPVNWAFHEGYPTTHETSKTPHLQAKIDLNTLRLEEGTYIDAALQSQYSDLVFSVSAEEDDAAYVYVMLEHQSTPDPDMVFRTLGYLSAQGHF